MSDATITLAGRVYPVTDVRWDLDRGSVTFRKTALASTPEPDLDLDKVISVEVDFSSIPQG